MPYRISLEGYQGPNASEAVQKISTKDTGVVRQLTKTANFITSTYENNIFSSLLPP